MAAATDATIPAICKTPPRYIARCSYGNDSIAMLQLMHEHGLKDVTAAYSDTDWASEDWAQRVEDAEAWVRSLGWTPARIHSVGFEQNVYDQTEAGMWPTRLRKHCTKYLKVLPFLKWVEGVDPDKRALVCVGVRRSESDARKAAPAFLPEKDDGRHVWHPLVEFSEVDRDALILKTPFPVLPHRSDECEVCINANRDDLRRASPRAIDRIEIMEKRVGRPMFNPAKFMGAEGIREVKKWADSARGKYRPPNTDVPEYPLLEAIADAEPATCEDNWCGM